MNGTVLFLSKESSMTDHLIRHIEKDRFTVRRSEDPYGAVSETGHANIDVIVLVLEGFEKECIEIIRQMKNTLRFTRIIIINNSDQLNLSIKCMKAGAFEDFLPPLDMRRLSKKISQAAKLRRADIKKAEKPLSRLDRLMMAVSFAEAGEVDTALTYMSKKKQGDNHG